MIYTASITTAANTPASSPKDTKIKVTNGIITQVLILFPSGCAGLVSVQLYDGGHQFVPSTEGQTLKGDGVLIPSPEFYDISEAPRWLTVRTWNLDEVYNHTIEVMITQLPREAVQPSGAYEGIIKSLKNLFIREGRET